MKQPWILSCIVAVGLCSPSFAASPTPEPVNANATPQARKLLAFLYEIQGRYTLAAQHNYASAGAKQTNMVRAITGKTPVMWGSDFSFCYQGSEPQEFQHCGPLNLTHPFEPLFYLKATPEEVRQRLVETALKVHKDGHIITLMWHAPPPGADNCVDGKKIWTWDKRPTPWFLESRRPELLRAICADKRVLTKDDVVIDAEGNYKIGAGE